MPRTEPGTADRTTRASMKILITGADGNVGSRLRLELSARGHEAIGIDIGDVDITDFNSTARRITDVEPDLVVHCAALTNVDRCAQDPALALRINAMGTQNIAIG